MPLGDLNPQEREIVWRCLNAAARGPFFPDWEFEVLFGVSRGEVQRMVRAGPVLDETREGVSAAINNALSNLLGYPHGEEERLTREVGASNSEIARIHAKWRSGAPGGVR